MSEIVTGADDWRSEEAKEKSELRKAGMSLLKTWIPDHPEAAVERDACYPLLKKAFGIRPRITFLSQLSSGIEDLLAVEYHEQPVSMQELLVQREGTEAFLDPRNALRVVRRKFGMMTLINRITSTFEHRNILAITLESDIEQAELLKFCKLMGERISDSAAEEELKFRKALSRSGITHVDVIFHADDVARRIPVPHEVRLFYARLGRVLRKAGFEAVPAGREFVEAHVDRLRPRAIRQLILYAPELAEAVEQPPGLDVAEMVLRAADEKALLTIARNLFDEYQIERREADRARALDRTPGPSDLTPSAEGPTELEEGATEADFLAEAEQAAGGFGEESDLVRLARALDTIRRVRGREFFARISMVGGEIDFLEAAHAGEGFEQVERTLATLDPLEGLREARKVPEAFYRARALAAAVSTLAAAGRDDDAREGAAEALEAARACKTADVVQAYAAALQALLAVRDEERAGEAVREALDHAHEIREADARAAGLMRVVSTLMEAGPLPAAVKTALSRHILGDDVHFWGRPEIEPPLVEAIVSLLSGADQDTLLFLQKVSAHPDPGVRGSVVRTMPFDGEDLRRILLSHLKDRDPAVRVEVMERIGWSADRTLGLYLVNHLRQTGPAAMTPEEKRALALNLARLDPERYLAFFNAMLGGLHTADPGMTQKFKPFKDDPDLQLAALEVLYHLNSREARRMLYHATQQAKAGSAIKDVADRIWRAVKGRPYGDPQLPRSPHDPEWTEEDAFDLLQVLDQVAPVEEAPAEDESEPEEVAEAPAAGKKRSRFDRPRGGLLSRLRRRLFGGDDDEPLDAADDAVEEAAGAEGDGETPEDAGPAPADETPTEPEGPPPALLHFDAVLLDGPEIWSGKVPMTFSLYVEEGAAEPVWREVHESVAVDKGAFAVDLGARKRLPSPLPNVVWLGVDVDGGGELQPRTRLSRARSVVQG